MGRQTNEMMKIISDKAGLFSGRQNIMAQSDKDVTDRIGRLLVRNPVAINALLKKYDVNTDTASPEELITALASAIAENDEQFNYELATLLASPRYSFPLGAAAITALISAIGTTLGGGLGLAKSVSDKRGLRDSIEGELRLSYQQSQEAEKARQAKIGLVVLLFLGVIFIIAMLMIFKPFAKKQ